MYLLYVNKLTRCFFRTEDKKKKKKTSEAINKEWLTKKTGREIKQRKKSGKRK